MDVLTERFEEMRFQGTHALFSPMRIDLKSVPEGLHRYELRHDDDGKGDPCQLAKGIMVNHYGSILTNEPLQLPASGYLDFEPEDLYYVGSVCLLTDFLVEYPPVERPILEITPLLQKEGNLLYSISDPEEEKRRGSIGHVRGDFGRDEEFWTSWWPDQEQLNTTQFKAELKQVVDWLRQDFGPLKDRRSMEGFCSVRGEAKIADACFPTHGFKIETPKYSFYLRCAPRRGDYDFYLRCYDKEAQRECVRIAQREKSSSKKRHEPER